METWLLRIRGRVQGIGFRDACIRRARSVGVSGWVRNRMDESVEALLQGPPETLATLLEWLREEVPGAWVEDIEVTELPPPFARFDGFERRPTA